MTVFIFHPNYYADIGPHILQVKKYRKTYDRLRKTGIPEEAFLQPEEATNEEVRLVHTKEYIADLLSGTHTPRTISSELPISSEIIHWCLLSAGGTILAARKALDVGVALNLSGGFHHAFADCAEGFCYINDLAVAIRVLEKEGLIARAVIIDCDLHQGNGTALIFRKDKDVFTFSIHQENIYPLKRKSDLDIGLFDLTDDENYLGKLHEHVPRILERHHPDIVIYQAGADPFLFDQLGTLKISKEGLRKRDDLILSECKSRSIPVAGTLGGGYAEDPEDTVDIHFQTALAFWES